MWRIFVRNLFLDARVFRLLSYQSIQLDELFLVMLLLLSFQWALPHGSVSRETHFTYVPTDYQSVSSFGGIRRTTYQSISLSHGSCSACKRHQSATSSAGKGERACDWPQRAVVSSILRFGIRVGLIPSQAAG